MKLQILIIAVEARRSNGSGNLIIINPGPEIKIEANIQGFFIAESADDVKRSVVHLLDKRSTVKIKAVLLSWLIHLSYF